MNDLHSITSTRSGHHLVTSSGLDLVAEIDSEGNAAWTWFAGNHGFAHSQYGLRRRLDMKLDYRPILIATPDQATHCNSAIATTIAGRDVVLVALFHQGSIIAVDRLTLRHRVLVSGLGHPHSIRARAGGWIVSDSQAGAVVLLDDNFWIEEIIENDFSWVQDALETNPGQLLIADANHNRLVEWNTESRCCRVAMTYSQEWKIFQLESIDEDWLHPTFLKAVSEL